MVSLLQASFIQGQNSVDNSIILLELTNSINHPYTKKGFIGMKLDLQKAYTRLEWDFIRETLIMVGLPPWMMDTIS